MKKIFYRDKILSSSWRLILRFKDSGIQLMKLDKSVVCYVRALFHYKTEAIVEEHTSCRVITAVCDAATVVFS